MKTNYHTHTYRCNHASGTDEDYVIKALENGFSVLGFSDHAPYPYYNGYIAPYRMQPSDKQAYLDSIVSLKKQYADKMHIYAGFECEPLEGYENYLRELKTQADYLIMGNHNDESRPGYRFAGANNTPEEVRVYTRAALRGMEWGVFDYMAHPDLTLGAYPVFDDVARDMSVQITRAAKALNLPLEYNLSGIEKQRIKPLGLGYPCERFWEIAAEEGCTAIIGVDAHFPGAFDWTYYEEGEKYLQSLGMKVIKTLPGLE